LKYAGLIALAWNIIQFILKKRSESKQKKLTFFYEKFYSSCVEPYVISILTDAYMSIINSECHDKESWQSLLFQFQGKMSQVITNLKVFEPLSEQGVQKMTAFLEEQENDISYCIMEIMKGDTSFQYQISSLALKGESVIHAQITEMLLAVDSLTLKSLVAQY